MSDEMPRELTREELDAMSPEEWAAYGRRQQEWSAKYFASIGGSGARFETLPSDKMNSDEFSDNYWNTPAVEQSSEVPLGGGALGQAYLAPQTDYGMVADPTGALNLAAQTVTTNAAAGGTLLASGGDVQPISAGEYGLNDFNQSLGLALGDTVRQVVASAGQVATNAVNTAGQRVVARVNSAQKTSVANTPKPTAMTMKPMHLVLLAAVVLGVVYVARKSRAA